MNIHAAKASKQVFMLDLGSMCLSLNSLLRSKSVSHEDIMVVFTFLVEAASFSSKVNRKQAALEVLSCKIISSRYLFELRTPQEQFILVQALVEATEELYYKYCVLGINLLTDKTHGNCSLMMGALYPKQIIIFALPN